MKKIYIYLTINQTNNKQYVGKHASNNIKKDTYLGSGNIISAAIKKYGRKNFKRIILEECTKNNWVSREGYWIKRLNSMSPNGYNLTYGGEGGGDTYSLLSEDDKQRWRERTSKIHKGKIISDEQRKKQSYAMQGKIPVNKGVPHSTETKQRMKKAWETREPITEETRRRMSIASGGRIHSSETKEKIGVANSQRVWKEESKIKISLKNKGLKRSQDVIEKMKRKYACKYCGKEMNKSNLTRYHNNNCKFKS